jgi:phospholipid/cholesterol/gamma-HCH transport system permease protein
MQKDKPNSSVSKKPFITEKIDSFFLSIYDLKNFIGRYFTEAFSGPIAWKETINQCYSVGFNSLPLVTLTGFITGVIFTKQSRPSLAAFGASSWLPSLISIAIIRALASLVSSLIVAGKVGSNMGAELGSMRVTEQIDAMEVSGTNPFKYLVVTRITAISLMMPILVLYTGFVSMMGSFMNIHANELTSFTAFIKNAFGSISFLDLFSSLIKGLFYGFTIGVAGCFQGYNAQNGTQGVGKAANMAVVSSMFLIFLEEIVIVQVVNAIR